MRTVSQSRMYISEGSYDSWAGCLVKVPGTQQRLFSYNQYGVSGARRAARKYRDELVARKGLLLVRHNRVAQERSRTGIVGVYQYSRDGQTIIGYIADCAGIGRKRFLFAEHGKAAKKLAIQARNEMVLRKAARNQRARASA